MIIQLSVRTAPGITFFNLLYMHAYVYIYIQICVVVAGLAIALCSAAPLLQNVNNTTQSCTSESNISLYNQLSHGTTFPQVRLNITSDQILENTILSLAQRLFNDGPKGNEMNFNITKDNTILNDVCRQKVDGKLSPNSGFIKNYNCPWDYKCDYDPHRIPQVLWQADCYSSVFINADSAGCSDCPPVQNSCVPVYYPVPVLYTSNCSPYDSSGDWTWQQIKIAVSCASKNENDQDFS